MKRKKGFTLLELMVTLAIFSVLTLMISAILIQSQKILVRTDKSSQNQNEVRVALLKIEAEAKSGDYDIIVASDKYGNFNNNNKWVIIEGESSNAREILRFTSSTDEVAKVYVEVYENNKHELVKFNINKTTNEIIQNSRETLISNIQGTDVNKIKVSTENIVNSSGKLVTINCTAITNENIENEAKYIVSFTTIDEKDSIQIDLNIGNSNTENGDNDLNNGDSGNNESNDENLDNGSSGNNSNIDTNIPFWDSSKIYTGGEIVQYNGIIYKAAYYNQNANPEIGNQWTIISEGPTVWKSTKAYLPKQKVIYNGIIYEAAYDSTNNNPEVGNAWTIISEEPTEWKATKVYLKYQKVSYNGNIYQTISDWNQGNNPEYGNGWIIIS